MITAINSEVDYKAALGEIEQLIDHTPRAGTPEGDRPAGSQPTRKSKRDDEELREEGKSESTGDAPMDPADESFIESK